MSTRTCDQGEGFDEPPLELKRFGTLLRRHREARNLTVKDVEKRIRHSGSWYHRWERAQYSAWPSPDMLRESGGALHIPYRDMLMARGYVGPDEKEPGVAYLIRKDDRRADLLRLLEGLPPASVEALTSMARIFVAAISPEPAPVSTGGSGA